MADGEVCISFFRRSARGTTRTALDAVMASLKQNREMQRDRAALACVCARTAASRTGVGDREGRASNAT
jgi:hypothetical protein